MSSKKTATGSTRDARLAQARKEQQAAERKRTLLLVSAAGLVIAFIVAAVGYAIVNESDDRQAASDLAGVSTFEYAGGKHTPSQVDYKESPPVGGEHNPAWLNCGVYDTPVPNENVVHSLEHGAVWIAYEPDLAEEQLDQLKDITPDTYAVLSPYKGKMESPIVVSAWGHQLEVDSADDPRIKGFIKEYRQGKQTPEPGAACTGGVGADGQLQ